MSVIADADESRTSARLPLPDPGEDVPQYARPTIALFLTALAVWLVSTWAAVTDRGPVWLTITANATVSFVMFTVVHDSAHYSLSKHRFVNRMFGRLSMLFVSPALSFRSFSWIHIEHHRYANDDANDPDTFASHGPWWQLPFRWASLDLSYAPYYLRHVRTRPRGEVVESAFLLLSATAVIVWAVVTGHFWLLAVVYLIPERIAVTLLGWWFDWLPHHGLEDTQPENQYRATRLRVGMEWLFTPLMFSQNYHLVHHLHPSIPFYRYVRTWRRNEEAYLEREAAIKTVFGSDLSSEEFREWKQMNTRYRRLLPTRMPTRSAAAPTFHSLRVSAVEPLTADSVLISFVVPHHLQEDFRFVQGQHVAVRTDLGGRGVRRNYSICSPASSSGLQIAVKRIPDGAFSTFATEILRPGDTLELMTPAGSFGVELHPLSTRHHVALAVGSGVTPVMSILRTMLEIEPESRFTLVYGNRTAESTMFRDELDELAARHADRLEIVHVRSGELTGDPDRDGRLDRAKIDGWLGSRLRPDTVDEWYLCGPLAFMTDAREALVAAGVGADQVHLELFTGYQSGVTPATDARSATITMRLRGREQTFDSGPGESILEAALQRRSDTPYACMGGACGTCRAKLVAGSVEMTQDFALSSSDRREGYVLTCQSHPTSPTVTVDYDI